jgi:two-component sensor histidine kinase
MMHEANLSFFHGPHSVPSAFARPAEDEAIRLAAVKRYAIVEMPPEATFDRITALAAGLFNVPISIISVVGANRVYFKSHHGVATADVARGPGASALALAPWLRQEFKHGFHFGVPLCTPEGHELGRLSVIDRRPRQIYGQPIHLLKLLAALVMDHMNVRLSARDADARWTVMASEIDHRAMNSLTLVSNLLQQQSRAVRSPIAAQQLTAAANRVLAVARVHQMFSADETAERVQLVAYLRQLCGELSDILATDIKIEGAEVSVPNRQTLAIGLVMNELVTNAKKHGAGQIKVVLGSASSGHHELHVCDEGEGLPEGFVADRPGGGIGMKMIALLGKELGGRISACSNPPDHPAGSGTCFTVTFPAA